MSELERSAEARHSFFLDEFANTDYCQRLAVLRDEVRGDDRFRRITLDSIQIIWLSATPWSFTK